MQKKNMKIKNNITITDQIRAIKTIVSYCFTDGEYTPYYRDMGMYEAIVENFLSGCKLKENEYAYILVEKDEDLRNLVVKFFYNGDNDENATKHNDENVKYISIMNFVLNNVKDIIEMKKQEYLNCTNEKKHFYETASKALKDFSKSVENISNLDLNALTPEVREFGLKLMEKYNNGEITSDNISDVIKNAVDYHIPDTEIYNGQKEQIGNLNKMLKESENERKELQKKVIEFESRNVFSDK